MRLVVALLMIIFVFVVPTHAAGVWGQGVYEFEVVGFGTATGTWTIVTTEAAVNYRNQIVGNSAVISVVGNSLAIVRLVRNSGTHTMQVCVNASCASVNNAGASDNTWQAIVFPLTGGTDTITITNTAGTVNLDYFIVLDDAGGSFPTPVPTATIVPTATPASTTTPQPTPTPQPTSTPLQYVWALDPSRRYGSVNGQITAFDYSADAAQIHIGNLLTMLLVSLWGMFIFCFLMWTHRKWWR